MITINKDNVVNITGNKTKTTKPEKPEITIFEYKNRTKMEITTPVVEFLGLTEEKNNVNLVQDGGNIYLINIDKYLEVNPEAEHLFKDSTEVKFMKSGYFIKDKKFFLAAINVINNQVEEDVTYPIVLLEDEVHNAEGELVIFPVAKIKTSEDEEDTPNLTQEAVQTETEAQPAIQELTKIIQ